MSKPDKTRLLRLAIDESLATSEELHHTATDALNKKNFSVFLQTLKENATERNIAHGICRLMEDTEDTDICIADVDSEHNQYMEKYTYILNRTCG